MTTQLAREELSRAAPGRPSAVTIGKFDGGPPVPFLCSLEERVALLRSLGVDSVGVLSFTSELAQLSYQDFVRLLVEQLDLRLLLIGPAFALGRDRAGHVAR